MRHTSTLGRSPPPWRNRSSQGKQKCFQLYSHFLSKSCSSILSSVFNTNSRPNPWLSMDFLDLTLDISLPGSPPPIASSSSHFPLGPHTCLAPLINPVFYSLRLSPSALLQLINKPRKQQGPVDLLVIMSTLFLLREPRDARDRFGVTAGNAKEMGHRKTQHEALGPVHVYNFLCKH